MLKIFENATFQMVDLLETLLQHEGRGFLAANATSAEHRHLFVLRRIEIFAYISDEIRKPLDTGNSRSIEGA